jgi:beta-glucuronidase
MHLRFSEAPGRVCRLIVLLTLVLGGGIGATSTASAASTNLTTQTMYQDSVGGRYLLASGWSYRMDAADQGLGAHFERDHGSTGWAPVKIPFNWNGTDSTADAPSIGWFRQSFVLPRDGRWKLRFESVTGQATVWLNGQPVGTHDGAYLPFELDKLPVRKGRNWLAIRVDTHHPANDLTFWRTDATTGDARYGWWNFGGISREVYLRRVDHVEVSSLAAVPTVHCAQTCTASLRVSATVTSASQSNWRTSLKLQVAGRALIFHPRSLAPGATTTFTTTLSVPRPRLWSPEQPSLYPLHALAYVDDPGTHGHFVGRYDIHIGLRTIRRDASGQLLLNDHPLLLHGASMHEETRNVGAAWGPAQRRTFAGDLERLHANFTRSHYPLHPAFLELCDRLGILVWDEIPVYQTPNATLDDPVQRAKGVEWAREMVARDHNHASVFTYSVSNELPAAMSAGQIAYLGDAVTAVRAADPERLVALDRYPDGQYTSYDVLRRFDLHGINEYFGWYYGTDAQAGGFLDKYHSAYPDQGIVVTEFGAEASSDGLATDKGTYQFQQRWLRTHLALYSQRPYILGALVWALRDFRVLPGWNGGSPHPQPPWNMKGLIDRFFGPKPAYGDVAQIYAGIHDGQWPAGLAASAPASTRGRSSSPPTGSYTPGP